MPAFFEASSSAIPRFLPSTFRRSQTRFSTYSSQIPLCRQRLQSQKPGPNTARPSRRSFHSSSQVHASNPPKSRDRGPPSTEDTQTDFSKLNVLGNATPPTIGIDACTHDGFALNSGLKVSGCGVLLANGEVFRWRPWLGAGRDQQRSLINAKGQWEVDKVAWGLLELLWPKPDLLILGTGPSTVPLAPATRKDINDLGIRIEIQDSRNAAAQFNLLATERGVQQVAAAMVPIGWRDPR